MGRDNNRRRNDWRRGNNVMRVINWRRGNDGMRAIKRSRGSDGGTSDLTIKLEEVMIHFGMNSTIHISPLETYYRDTHF